MQDWTNEQRDAIEEYREKGLLVSAAAGSGKTAVLIERIYQLITNDKISLDNLLIVTFTNAATQEMRDRLRKRLNEDINALKKENTQEAKDKIIRLSSELSKLSTALICTFNSFALWIVRNYYQVIGVDPSLKVCDEYKATLLKTDALDELFAKKYEKKDEDFLWFLDRYSNSKNDRNVRELIDKLYTFLDTLPDSEAFTKDFLPKQDELFSYAIEETKARVSKVREYCFVLDELYKGYGIKSLSQSFMECVSDMDSIIAALSSEDPACGLNLLFEYKFPSLRASKDEAAQKKIADEELKGVWEKDIKDTLNKAKDIFCTSKEELFKELKYIEKPLSILFNLAKEYKLLYQKNKQAAGLLDFSDAEHFAIDILKSDLVREELRNKFECVLVDEYQDSNYIQETIIEGVSKKTNVFMVGDVKQSIYRFRHAEPKLFTDKYKLYKEGVDYASSLDLSKNFRCKGGIIEFVNALFKNLMSEQSCGIDYNDDAKLIEGNVYNGEYIYKPELYLIERNLPGEPEEAMGFEETEEEALKNEELEALQAVEIIQKYHGMPFCVMDDIKKDEDGKILSDGVRKLEYSDMAILLRSAKNKSEFYYDALTKAGIPAVLDRNVGLYEAPEVQLLLNLLRVIDNFKRDIPLISCLHSPCFGFSSEDLAKIRLFLREKTRVRKSFSFAFEYYMENGDEEALKNKCIKFSEKIDSFRVCSYALPLADFINTLLSQSGLDLFAASLSDGEQRNANLRLISTQAQEYESQNAGGLSGFLSFIDNIQSDKRIDVGLAKNTKSTDAVRIMTVHKSKGMQFPFVLLAGCGDGLKSHEGEGKACFHKDLGSSICPVDKKTGIFVKPASLKIIGEKAKWEERAEFMRVLYVATTRAKDILVLLGSARNAQKLKNTKKLNMLKGAKAASYLQMVVPFIDDSCIHLISRDVLEAKSSSISYGEEAKRIASFKKSLAEGFNIEDKKLELSKDELEKRLNFNYRKEQDKEKRKLSVSELAREDSAHLAAMNMGRTMKAADFTDSKKISGAEIGNAYHSLMERLPFNKEVTEGMVEHTLEDLVCKNIILKEAANHVEPKRVLSFFNSELGNELRSVQKVNKETPFVLKTTRNGKEVLVQGTIDCWYEKDGKLILLDYKSSYANKGREEEEKARLLVEYKTQLSLYKEALEKICKKEVSRSILYLFSLDSWVEL